MATKVFKGRQCLEGEYEGLAEVSDIGMNICATYSDVMFEGATTTGGFCQDHDNASLYKHDLRDKILCLPQTIGSSSSATAFLKILEAGVAPKAMLFANHIDSLASCGLLMSDVWQGQRIFTVDNLGQDFLDAVKTGDKVAVAADGTVTITPKSGVGATVKRAKPEEHNYARNSLGGHVGADANYTIASQTGAAPQTKDPKFTCQLTLTPEEQAMADGAQGEVAAKCIKTIIKYGEFFGADKLVDLQAAPHMAMSWGSDVIEPFLKIYRTIADAGLKAYAPFTADPKPTDYDNLPMSDEETKALKAMYHRIDELEEVNLRLGMRKDAWSCACYLPQMGNRPKYGDNLAWSESSAINFSNSCLGARTNRNSMGIDMICSVLGKAPHFGLMIDEGRKADWLIDVQIGVDELDHIPHPEMVGAVIGMKCVEDIPYVIGMDKFIKGGICEATEGYMKDFGAATASNGAVGLCHTEGVTPEAIKLGRSLLKPGHKTYVIDMAELGRIYGKYPNMWKKKDAIPDRIFIGCPHLSYQQYVEWGNRIVSTMEGAKKDKVAIQVCMFGSSFVRDDFKRRNAALYAKLEGYGVIFPLNCPVMWCTSPVANAETIATSSNKVRVYTTGRFFFDAVLCYLMVHGTVPEKLVPDLKGKGGSCSSAPSGDIEDTK